MISGTATLGGRLRLVNLENSFPKNGISFTPITAAAVAGSFDEKIYDVPFDWQVFDVLIGESVVNNLLSADLPNEFNERAFVRLVVSEI